jgi:Xaa-Pro dipeptidase
MEEHALDAFLVTEPANICYFTGFDTLFLWEPCIVVLPSTGAPRALINEGQEPRWSTSAALGTPVTYSDTEGAVSAARRFVKSEVTGPYAADEWAVGLPAAVWEGAMGELESLPRRSGIRVLWATRLIKSEAEIEFIRDAGRMADAGVAGAVEAAREGATDYEIAAGAAEQLIKAGSGPLPTHPIVAVGPRASVMHSEASSGRRLSNGESVFVEFTGSSHRYTAPVMRTIAIREPSQALIGLADAAKSVLSLCMEEIRPGVVCREVASKVNAAVRSAAPGVYFHGHAGYPVGLAFPPCWEENLLFTVHESNEEEIVEGMVFHLPITLRETGVRGVGLSYTVIVRAGETVPVQTSKAELIVK